MRLYPLLAVMVALAGCVGPTAPTRPAPEPVPVPSYTPPPVLPQPLPGKDWRDWPMTPGDWVYRQDARGSIALFGPRGADAVLTLRCDRAANTLYLSRQGFAAAAVALTVRTSTLLRTLSAAPTGGTPSYVAVALQPRDPLLDAMGYSRGRFVVEQAGAPTLVVPAWAEIERVTEDCRR